MASSVRSALHILIMKAGQKGVDFFGATFRATSTDCNGVAFIVYYHYMVGFARNSYRTPNEIWKSTANKNLTYSCYNCNWYVCK